MTAQYSPNNLTYINKLHETFYHLDTFLSLTNFLFLDQNTLPSKVPSVLCFPFKKKKKSKKNHNYPLSVFSMVCQHHGERIGIHISVFSLLLAECFSERSYLKKHVLNTYVKGCVQELFTTHHFTCFPLWIEWSKAFSLSCDIHIWDTSGVHQTEIM